MSSAQGLISAENIAKNYGKGDVLKSISLGVLRGERIGIVGRNGGGKSTLLRILVGAEAPDSGRISFLNGLSLGYLAQVDSFADDATILSAIFGDSATHSWASDPKAREVLEGLFGSHNESDFNRPIAGLSGGERRRVSLAKLLVSNHDLICLDEPTNHLDVEGVNWLAQYLKREKRLAVVVITHDRWFLDEVSDKTWEVVNAGVEEYEGGYSAFVLAKAERIRQSDVETGRRNNLIKKELAWLRRGAPARTTKPKFRVDAANQLISAEPPPRDSVELLNFATNRLGKRVFELHDVTLGVAGRVLAEHINVNFAPGARYAIVGANGAGKTSFLQMLAGRLKPMAGHMQTGQTVKLAFLTQHLDELEPQWRVLEAVEDVAKSVDLGKGRELSASQLCERLGFGKDAQWTPVRDLSGGERRRLQLTRLLMEGPNVLFLDEPTNDFDVETLASLEDLLDGFAGTIIVVSHDRYFLERVCDITLGFVGDGILRDLPRGLDQYFELRSGGGPDKSEKKNSSPALATIKIDQRELKKSIEKTERGLARRDEELKKLEVEMASAEVSTDFTRLAQIHEEIERLRREKEALEQEWLALMEGLEGK
ncbi:MAG: ABC-F family ATP-binding cassette domain-containing protein [Candidatus Nanopelagicaceae bacterium]